MNHSLGPVPRNNMEMRLVLAGSSLHVSCLEISTFIILLDDDDLFHPVRLIFIMRRVRTFSMDHESTSDISDDIEENQKKTT